MLATDRCFWTLSLVWLRMFLLGDELLFFFFARQSMQEMDIKHQGF